MSFSSSPNFTSSLHLGLLGLLFITLLSQVEGRLTQEKSDVQVLQRLFGKKISSVVLAPSAIIEGSAESIPLLSQNYHDHGVESRMFLDFLRRQRKVGGRSRKGVARGCFGMKVDRIGVISGLGC